MSDERKLSDVVFGVTLNAQQAMWEAECMKWRGRVLTGEHAHYCFAWDGLPVDETTPEWPCTCSDDRTMNDTKKTPEEKAAELDARVARGEIADPRIPILVDPRDCGIYAKLVRADGPANLINIDVLFGAHDTLFLDGVGTIRRCQGCGRAVVGGPTLCTACRSGALAVARSLALEEMTVAGVSAGHAERILERAEASISRSTDGSEFLGIVIRRLASDFMAHVEDKAKR